MTAGTPDELAEFLDALHWVMPNLNDTFAYACADSERIYMDGDDEDDEPGNQGMLLKMWRQFGLAGIHAYVGRMRDADPIPPLRTDEYWRAKAALKNWTYVAD